jgi:hypothetical protein
MKKIYIVLLSGIFSTLLMHQALQSQTINLTGKVINSQGAAISGASVSVADLGINETTDGNGNFTINYSSGTSLNEINANGLRSYFDGHALYIASNNEPVTVTIHDVLGRQYATILSSEILSGEFKIYPAAYIQTSSPNFYLISVEVGEQTYTHKFLNKAIAGAGKGLFFLRETETSDVPANVKSVQASFVMKVSHDDYRTKTYSLDCNDCPYMEITLEDKLPAAPDNLVATSPNSSSVELSWNDNSDNETGFRIERAINFLGWEDFSLLSEQGANTTSYTDGDVIQGNLYKYRVAAFNDGGTSAFSEEVPVTVQTANPIELSGPSTSSGDFSLTVTYSWPGMLGSTSDRFVLEESTSPSSGFAEIDNSPWNQRPTSYTFNLSRSTGTYYYRARAYNATGWTNYTDVISVAVNTPAQTADLTIVNNSSYNMIDIRLNDQQQAATGEAIYPQGEYTFEFSSSGSVSYYLGVGFWDDTYRDVWFYLVGTTNVTVGANTTITFENPTIAQMLTNFSGSRNWTGEYWDAYAGIHFATYTYNSNGSWTLYDDGTPIASGTVSLVDWPVYSSYLTFQHCGGCEVITLWYPFGQFYQNNGPASWPTILYTAQ